MVPKINVYLPDGLAAAVKDAAIPVSAICQSALERAVREVTALRESEQAPHHGLQDWAAGTGVAFFRYTNRARHAVALGRQAALDANHSYVGTEHLLLGILAEGSNLAVKIIQTLDAEPRDVEAEVRGYRRRGDETPADTPISGNTKGALELAVKESARLLHNYI